MTVAKSLEGANLVWNRVNEFMLQNASAPTGAVVNRAAFLRDLKLFLATHKGNPKLQFLAWSNLTATQQTVPELSTGGATLYAIYNHKQNTATAAYFKANDSATTAGGSNGSNAGVVTIALLLGNDEVGIIFQPGLVLATGLQVESSTTAAGGTDSSTGDGPNGFAIVG